MIVSSEFRDRANGAMWVEVFKAAARKPFEVRRELYRQYVTAIKNAFFGNDPIGFQVLDATGGQGLQADFSITNFSRSEALEEAISVSVTAKVTYSATAPSWIGS